jgi:lipid-A-disaccharide synthase-like uncharacterized protein
MTIRSSRLRRLVTLLPPVEAPGFDVYEEIALDWSDSLHWLALGLLGNVAFLGRFLIQWVASERAGRSYIPRSLGYLSLIEPLLLLAYAIPRRDSVFVLAYLPNGVVHLRNLALLRHSAATASPCE